ncbi:hypothetical protein ACFL1R_01290 [Candidatus Latescibacterota bacterium]
MNRPGLVILTVVCFAVCSFCSAGELNIEEFIDNASITYKTGFEINTTVDRWNRILDNPVLMGRLWKLYEFSPKYVISSKGTGYHIFDPSGIEGDLEILEADDNHRIFFGKGKMKNWFVPVSLRGNAIFLLYHTVTHNRVSVKLNIFGEGGDTFLTRLLLKAISPILSMSIHRRVTNNLRDLKIIVNDIENNPDAIKPFLSGDTLKDFNLLLEYL